MQPIKETAEYKIDVALPCPVNQTPRRHVWSLRITALLLLMQAIGLGGLTLFDYRWISGLSASEHAAYASQSTNLALIRLTQIVLALLAALASLGVVRVLHAGWVLAMIVQAILLLLCLFLYVQLRPVGVYPVMVLSILLVLYLNSRDVRLAFRIRSARTVEQLHED